MEKGKQSKEYFDACSVIEMNELDAYAGYRRKHSCSGKE